MSGSQRGRNWLEGWRERRRRKPPRKVNDKLFGPVEDDSDEKLAQRHTRRGKELAAEDRRFESKGGTGGGLM